MELSEEEKQAIISLKANSEKLIENWNFKKDSKYEIRKLYNNSFKSNI